MTVGAGTVAVSAPARRWRPRALVVLVAWSAWTASTSREVFNQRGWSAFAAFWQAVVNPELDPAFLRLTAQATAITAAYALLGTLVSVAIGVVGGMAVAERRWDTTAARRPGSIGVAARRLWPTVQRTGARLVFVVPRATHEVIWALLLVQVLGFDPWVAIIAIGIQFGAVTAKVFGELIDDADPAPYRHLRAGGAGRAISVLYGIVPLVRADMISYSFYRFECAVRSAAVLGIIGVGGLGLQLDLSFESLRYDELWTLMAALMILSGGADWWSSRLRRSEARPGGRRLIIMVSLAVPLAWWHLDLAPDSLWSARTGQLAADLVGDLFPPRLGPGGWSELIGATVDTLAMSTLATAIATAGGLAAAAVAARSHRPDAPFVRRLGAWSTRAALLLARAVPAPVWAFLVILVMFPGIWPGAVALGVYNAGVLGRLFAEVFEDHDDRARRHLATAGASRWGQLLYAVLPVTANRLIALALYRWEVITRETVIVGVVDAAGLGRLIQEHIVARDDAAVLGAIGALTVLTVGVELTSAALRRTFR